MKIQNIKNHKNNELGSVHSHIKIMCYTYLHAKENNKQSVVLISFRYYASWSVKANFKNYESTLKVHPQRV